MHVLRAEHLGFCFGVRDALKAVGNVEFPREVTIHGELVHNRVVLHQLDVLGFARQDESDRSRIPATPRVMITAHGVSDVERRRLQLAGKELIDTTCPLVTRVHRSAQELAEEGRHVIVIGRPGHVEVLGIVEDLPSVEVIPDVASVGPRPFERLGIVCQSTTPPRLAEQVVFAIREKNPAADVRYIDTICQPTRDRQEAVLKLVPQVDVMVVVGGRNSNNTRELVRLCEERGVATHHVESAADLRAEWFQNATTCGLTAGTSSLDMTIDAVEAALLKIGSPTEWRSEMAKVV